MPDRGILDEASALHRRAMELADEASAALREGNRDAFTRFTQTAYESEASAARLLEDSVELEPTRSVLYRSAASFALELGEQRQAEQLISTALAGDPPEEIADELRDL